MIKCYNTLTREYQDIQLTPELEQEIKRSYWREEQQERRYNKRVLEFEDYLQYKQYSKSVEETIILNQEIEILNRNIEKLKSKERLVVYLVYFQGMNNVQAAKVLGVSGSYASRLLKRAKEHLKELILLEYEY